MDDPHAIVQSMGMVFHGWIFIKTQKYKFQRSAYIYCFDSFVLSRLPVFLWHLNNKNCIEKFCKKIFLRTFAIAFKATMEP
jgi:hypothetical protein